MLKIQINDIDRVEEFLEEISETIDINEKAKVKSISLYIEFESERILFFVKYSRSTVRLEYLIKFEKLWNFLTSIGPMDLDLNCAENPVIKISKDYKTIETVERWSKSEALEDDVMFGDEIYEVII